MKTIQFSTSKVNLLFVKLPDGIKNPFIFSRPTSKYICYVEDKMTKTYCHIKPYADWQLQGFTTELTNEQMERVCKDAEEFASLLESLGIEITENYVLLTSVK